MNDSPLRIGPQFVANLTEEERRSIIAEYDEFERVGSIGECTLRIKAQECFPHGQIVLSMRDLAFECHRYYSVRFIQREDFLKAEYWI